MNRVVCGCYPPYTVSKISIGSYASLFRNKLEVYDVRDSVVDQSVVSMSIGRRYTRKMTSLFVGAPDHAKEEFGHDCDNILFQYYDQ